MKDAPEPITCREAGRWRWRRIRFDVRRWYWKRGPGIHARSCSSEAVQHREQRRQKSSCWISARVVTVVFTSLAVNENGLRGLTRRDVGPRRRQFCRDRTNRFAARWSELKVSPSTHWTRRRRGRPITSRTQMPSNVHRHRRRRQRSPTLRRRWRTNSLNALRTAIQDAIDEKKQNYGLGNERSVPDSTA